MDNLGIGKPIMTKQQRDAIHIAIAPVTAAEKLKAGQHVGFTTDGRIGKEGIHIGVVDPFLKDTIQENQEFWLFLYPETITSIRHDWVHPSFAAADWFVQESRAAEVAESVLWLREFASDLRLSYEELIGAGHAYIKNGVSYCLGFNTPDRVWSDGKEFWRHFKAVTGATPGDDEDSAPFRCAC